MSRWMPVYEDDMTHWLWDQPQRYQWWLEIRFRAATRPGVRYVGGTNLRVNVNRGEWPVTISYLSNHWHSDDGAIKGFLEALEGDGLIVCQRVKLVTFIRVVGFERYCFQKQTDIPQEIEYSTPHIEPDIDESRILDDGASETPIIFPTTTQELTGLETDSLSHIPTIRKTPTQPPDNNYNKTNTEKNKDKEQTREFGYVSEYKNSKANLEASALSLHCTQEVLVHLIDDFYQSILVTEEWHKSFTGFKKHFMNWARLRLEKINQNETTRTNRPYGGNQTNGSRRRGPIKPACGLNED